MAATSGPGLIGIGDNVVDLYRDRGIYFPGGNSLNVAVLARRFGLSQTEYIGIIGNDAEGAHVWKSLVEEGLSDAWLRVAEGPNGKAQVDHDESGERIFVTSNLGGIRRKVMLRLDDDDFALIERLGHVHSSCFSYIEAELPRIAAAARQLSYDFSTNRDSEYLREVCPHLDLAFLSGQGLDDDGIAALIDEVQDCGVERVCVTMGERGALWAEGRTRLRQPVSKAKVIDTMGAGDAFIAGFLSASIQGVEPDRALQHAADCAAESCGWEGAWGHPALDKPD
ncbi:PfkB family carbohydrate kinase [Notoacmeibacter ruber]|uniref:Fructoselysine 6-kinase n=1 Tax=Notoacmeibacter ruber TaxID=2670375 RepID=A0A3L7J9A1_9HYPH|nr:PfkB family carbohydrate kinase [Notoacmeibacter ruber]RLQ87004.1 fructoselysine 6-kinase [Notoacmeibacter ruber]